MRKLTPDEKIAAYDWAATLIESTIDRWGHSMCASLFCWCINHISTPANLHEIYRAFPEMIARKPVNVYGAYEYWFDKGQTGNEQRVALLRECINDVLKTL